MRQAGHAPRLYVVNFLQRTDWHRPPTSRVAGVWLPEALERKYPNAGREFGWFWVFPSLTLSTDPRAGTARGGWPRRQTVTPVKLPPR